jgi:hypothetical protein
MSRSVENISVGEHYTEINSDTLGYWNNLPYDNSILNYIYQAIG